MEHSEDYINFLSYQDIPDAYFDIGTPGVFLQWDRRSPSSVSVAAYNILRAPTFDGNYVMIATVPFPLNTFTDQKGHPNFYYRIQEVAQDGTIIGTGQPFYGEEMLVKSSLYYEVKEYMKLPIYDEEVLFNRSDGSIGDVAFSNWSYWPRPVIRIEGPSNNGNNRYIILSEDTPITNTSDCSDPSYPDGLTYKVDYQGRIYFLKGDGVTPQVIDPADTVYASYGVELFTHSQMNSALYMSLQGINAQPGTDKYMSVSAAPYYWDLAIVVGAAYYLYRSLLVGLSQRQRRILIMDPDSGAFDSINALRETVKMYKEQYDEQLKVLPASKYPRIGTITTPEFNMPGGRSRMFRWIWKNGAS